MNISDSRCNLTGLVCHQVKLNPDISGPGVIIAYATSAVLSILVIFLGYYTDSLAEEYYNEFDKRQIFNKSGQPKIGRQLANHDRKRRMEVLQRFILALSDQQLITAIAVAVGALAQSWETTVADMAMVTALVWYSFIVHLVTLTVLKDYLHKHAGLRTLRLACISVTLGLLIFSLLVSTIDTCPGTLLACTYGQSYGFDVHVFTLPVILVLGLFLNSIFTLYAPMGSRGTAFPLLVASARFACWMFTDSKICSVVSKSANREPIMTFTASELEVWYLRPPELSSLWKFGALFQCYYLESFSFKFGSVAFLSVYSTVYFGQQAANTDLWTSSIGFGQILPLLLLLLPFFAGCESISELRGNSGISAESLNERRHSRTTMESQNLVPISKRIEEDFESKSANISRYFPFEFASLDSVPKERSIQVKQALIRSLSSMDIKKSDVLDQRALRVLVVTLHIIYCIGIAAEIAFDYFWAMAGMNLTCTILGLLGIVFAVVLDWPYLMCYFHLTRLGNQKKKAKLLKILQIAAKKGNEQLNTGDSTSEITTAVMPTVLTPAGYAIRREWTI